MDAKRRFEFCGHTFRIVKSFSYDMAYKAFCHGNVEPEEFVGKTAEIMNVHGYKEDFKVVEVANKTMAVPGRRLQVFDDKNGCIKRTYITVIKAEQERQWWYYWQRDWRGFDGSEMWSLDSKILEWLVPRLKRFAECGSQGWPIVNKNGHVEYRNSKEIVEQMVEGFQLLKDKCYDGNKTLSKHESQLVNRSFNLFKKHFGNLWT